MPLTTVDLICRQDLGKLVDHRDIDLTGHDAPQKVVRVEVRTALNGRFGTERTDDAILVADELVSNALKHAGGPVSFILDIYEKGAAVAVVDRGTDIDAVPAAPSNPSNDLDDIPEDGRGMFLIAFLSTAWSVEKAEAGKVVMAFFAAPCPTRTSSAASQSLDRSTGK
ncbi:MULTISPECIES: ATP-binding protein [unclassified Streptosporangium]|uniref:ATP-binding protein n=1 Tax=unclassified Streptosporangium TaxID=2632669 RepID=UPI002E284D63|nr:MULTISPECIES: ATP-binding protein [unclassified Streptosporangium]